MKQFLQRFFNYRVRALIRKEFNQIKRDRRLRFPDPPARFAAHFIRVRIECVCSNVRLGVVDDSRTPESRELIATLTESKSFALAGYYSSVDRLGGDISRARLMQVS